MAHSCIKCGTLCNCKGDIDDIMIDDPAWHVCEGCGCDDADWDCWDDYFLDDDEDEEPETPK